jgi:hypothetical protein
MVAASLVVLVIVLVLVIDSLDFRCPKLPGSSGREVTLSPLKRLEIGFYLGSATFQEGWEG